VGLLGTGEEMIAGSCNAWTVTSEKEIDIVPHLI
jgi:hypothetical protein